MWQLGSFLRPTEQGQTSALHALSNAMTWPWEETHFFFLFFFQLLHFSFMETGRDWSSSVKSFRPGMAFGQPQLHWLQLHYFLKSRAEDPHSDFNQSAHEEEEGRTRHDCGNWGQSSSHLIQTPSSTLQLLLYTYNTINNHVAKDAKNSLCENHT